MREPTQTQGLRIAVVTGGIPHYRWPFFSELADRGAEVHAIAAGRLPEGALATRSPDDRVALTQLPRSTPRWRSDVLEALRVRRPDVILVEHGASLDYAWTVLLSRATRAPRILWTHGIARQELYGGERGLPSHGRWMQLRLADGIACYDRHMAGRMRELYPGKPVGVAPNSTDGRPIAAARADLGDQGVATARRALGLASQFYIAGLGRFIAEKQFGRLLRIAAALRKRGLDVGVLLVGGGPEEGALRVEAATLGLEEGRGVVFAGSIAAPGELARWLVASDLCVSPGPLGLSVSDCMFAGVPIASHEPAVEGPHHGPEWRYLIPETTGFFAKQRTDEALAAVCADYLARPADARAETRRACVNYASDHLGVDRMACGMLDVIHSTLRER